MNYTNYELETIFNYNQAETTADVYTCDKALMRKLDGFCAVNPECELLKQDDCSKTYKIPKKWIKVQMPRMLTEEQKAKVAERLARGRNKDI